MNRASAARAFTGSGHHSNELNRSVVVAVITVGVMEMPIDDVVDVVPMGYGFVATAWPVDMVWIVAGALVIRCAGIGVLFGDFQAVLIDVVAVDVMEMPVVKVIDVIAMPNGCVPTTRTMLVVMIGVLVAWMI